MKYKIEPNRHAVVTALPTNPFTSDYAERVPLSSDPLARVLVQVRFLPILMLSTEEGVARFQDFVREDFPYLLTFTQQDEISNIGSGGSIGSEVKSSTVTVHHFVSKDQKSRLTLMKNALTLETAEYIQRERFISSFEKVLDNFFKNYQPIVNGMGFRYVNRLPAEGEDGVPPVSELVIPQLLGVRSTFNEAHCVRERFNAEVITPEGRVILNWGFSPARELHDYAVLYPVDVPTWYLDIDSTTVNDSSTKLEDIDRVMEGIVKLADRGRTIFSWSVTQKFFEIFKTKD